MLPAQLLRVKIKNKGKNIEPLFCQHTAGTNSSNGDEANLAAKLIDEFNESWKNNERNGLLSERVNLLEEQYGDFKLVRALYTLLQRRCIFGPNKKTFMETGNNGTTKNLINGLDSLKVPSSSRCPIDPFYIRRQLFEESSRRGFALTALERAEIMDLVASRLGISTITIAENMWSDLEDNMVIEHFFSLSPQELIGWYNLSLVQTMLFNCTHLEFFVRGGIHWKRVLRDLKRLGLMYFLEQRQKIPADQEKRYGNQRMRTNENSSPQEEKDEAEIVCAISGPLSMFKLTDRYGTSIAKLIPSILSASKWFIKASIVRKNFVSGKKIYEFELSNDRSPLLLCEPVRIESKIVNGNGQFTRGHTDITSGTYYDSKVEESFAKRFIQSGNGWALTREPDPIVLSDGKALIPDFMFEKYGKKIYFEIVGFWTTQYLEKKLEKIRDISATQKISRLDFLVAVNSDYAASSNSTGSKQRPGIFQLSNFIEKNHLITYKGDNIPLKPILEYLKNTEQIIEKEIATGHSDELLEELDQVNERLHSDNMVISIEDIAKKCAVPAEAVLRIIKSKFTIEARTKDSFGKDEKTKFILVGRFLISKMMANKIRSILETNRLTKYNEASLLFKGYGIPDECHTDLVSKLGFEIIWEGMDYNAATIEKKYP